MKDLARLISDIAEDRVSGATEILHRAIEVLRLTTSPPDRLGAARAICRAQPAMASLWNAALAAVNDDRQPARFDRFVERVQRAPAALTRVARHLFVEPGAAGNARPLSLVTLSSSASVRHVCEGLASTRGLRVACAEGRPALEGRGMAASLAKAGIDVTLFSDAAIAEALHDADAVVLGADSVASEWFINKVGSRMLAAAARTIGVPVYVIASPDKFCAPSLSSFIVPHDGVAREIWDSPPPGVVVRNPYFERVSRELIVAVITDGGIVPAADVPAFCASLESAAAPELMRLLAQS